MPPEITLGYGVKLAARRFVLAQQRDPECLPFGHVLPGSLGFGDEAVARFETGMETVAISGHGRAPNATSV